MSQKNLINNEEVTDFSQPPPYQQVTSESLHFPTNDFETITSTNPHENATVLTNSINCQVCRQFINLDQKQSNLVVKCGACGEATPIKAAPPGKKYVRCTCNGLLICKANSVRVGCPRPNCKSIITLAPSTDAIGVSTGLTSQTGLLSQSMRVICANCGNTFIVNSEISRRKKYMASKCPHCQTLSSIGPGYSRIRWSIYFIIGLIFLFIGIGVTTGTYINANGGFYVVYVGAFVVGLIFLIRSFLYCRMPVSTCESGVSTNNV